MDFHCTYPYCRAARLAEHKFRKDICLAAKLNGKICFSKNCLNQNRQPHLLGAKDCIEDKYFLISRSLNVVDPLKWINANIEYWQALLALRNKDSKGSDYTDQKSILLKQLNAKEAMLRASIENEIDEAVKAAITSTDEKVPLFTDMKEISKESFDKYVEYGNKLRISNRIQAIRDENKTNIQQIDIKLSNNDKLVAEGTEENKFSGDRNSRGRGGRGRGRGRGGRGRGRGRGGHATGGDSSNTDEKKTNIVLDKNDDDDDDEPEDLESQQKALAEIIATTQVESKQ
jgi:uncharacterized membrane protein YgcG